MQNFKYERLCMDFVEKIQTRKIVLFGAGVNANNIISRYYPYDGEVFRIWDNNPAKWGRKLLGVPIFKPEISGDEYESLVVLITIVDEIAASEIEMQLSKMGVRYVYHSSILSLINDFARYNGDFTRSWHEMNSYNLIENNVEKIQLVRGLLYDDKSRFVYDKIIQKRKYNLYDYTDICDDIHDHYFQTGLLKYTDKEVFIDGGAYLGENTIRLSHLIGEKLARSYCFEPDGLNYARLVRNLTKIYGSDDIEIGKDYHKCDKFFALNFGLSNANESIGFNSTGHYGSTFIHGGQEKVSTVKLDDVIEEEDKVTLLKLDTEGMEIVALEGAERIIKEHKPKLAISIYHKIEDLWEIPLLIHSFVPEYKLFVRHQMRIIADSMLYATL